MEKKVIIKITTMKCIKAHNHRFQNKPFLETNILKLGPVEFLPLFLGNPVTNDIFPIAHFFHQVL